MSMYSRYSNMELVRTVDNIAATALERELADRLETLIKALNTQGTTHEETDPRQLPLQLEG